MEVHTILHLSDRDDHQESGTNCHAQIREVITLTKHDEQGCSDQGADIQVAVPCSDNAKINTIRRWMPSLGTPVTLLGVIVMSFSDICIEISTQYMNPIQVTILFAIAMLMTSITCLVIHSVKEKDIMKRKYSKIEWTYLLFCGVTNACGFTFINFAINCMPVGDAVSVMRSMPIFAGIIGCVFLKESLRIIDFMFIACCIIGVVLIARPSFIFPIALTGKESNELLGVMYALASAISFAISFSVGKKLSRYKIKPYVIISVNSSICILLNYIIWLTLRKWDCAPHYVLLLTIAGGVLTGVGQILVFWSFSKEKVVVITVILATSIIFIYVLQILIVKITPYWLSGVGALFIFIACIGITIRSDNTTIPETVVA